MKKIMLLLVLLAIAISTKAADQQATIEELKMLPSFCVYKHRDYRSPESKKKWQKTFGELWGDMHHYCWGVNFRNRAAKSKNERGFNLNQAVDNIDYTLRRTPKDHFYRPQILLDMAKAKKMQKKYDEAIVLDEEAIALKNDFIPAYLDLSRLYKKLGDKKKAKEVIELGLKYKPDSKVLKKKLKRLSK